MNHSFFFYSRRKSKPLPSNLKGDLKEDGKFALNLVEAFIEATGGSKVFMQQPSFAQKKPRGYAVGSTLSTGSINSTTNRESNQIVINDFIDNNNYDSNFNVSSMDSPVATRVVESPVEVSFSKDFQQLFNDQVNKNVVLESNLPSIPSFLDELGIELTPFKKL